MVKRAAVFCLAVGLALSLSGCVTFGKKKDLQIQGLKNQVAALESQLVSKDQEISGLKAELESASQNKGNITEKPNVIEAKSRPTVRQIQTALLNAGYNPGKVDGRMGKQTREAIKSFQAANQLKADGNAGKKTWGLLSAYLEKKIK
jgi:peptidoglycan hydrolase-like protein with peptidoglycan-binding domain